MQSWGLIFLCPVMALRHTAAWNIDFKFLPVSILITNWLHCRTYSQPAAAVLKPVFLLAELLDSASVMDILLPTSAGFDCKFSFDCTLQIP
jgi:hypothetical protein